MRVLEVREPFGIDSVVFTTRPDPAAGPRDVVVRLNALSLNYRDYLVIDGINRWRPRGTSPYSLRRGYASTVAR